MTENETSSRFAAKSFSSGEGGESSSSAEWAGQTEKFLSEKPAAAAAAAAAFVPRPDLCLGFRHSGWVPQREKVDAVLSVLPCVSQRRVGAFRSCGADAVVQRLQTTINPFGSADFIHHYKYRIVSTKCHDRWCLPCSQERAMRARAALNNHMEGMGNVKILTLTLLASDDELKDILDRITRHFRAMRNTSLWKKNVKGGVATIEAKIGDGSGKWHVHYHVVMQAAYIPQRELSNLWFKITGDSYIVDIRPMGSLRGGISYITKYITKAADRSVINSPPHLAAAIQAFTGRRLVSTFGTFRGVQLMERVPDDADTVESPIYTALKQTAWETVGPLDALITRSVGGDYAALKILRALAPAKFKDSS